MARAVALLAIFVLAAPSVGAEALPQAEQDRLAHFVQQDCGSCHGLKMTGGLGSAITPEALEGHTVDGLTSIILDGIPGTAMPPWRPLLTEIEAQWIAEYLLEVSP
ncbi:cytochrome c [Roseobacter sp. OBYS 0001]|uniref:c-type cytochrome n=1 Tax=Roseobacter sp. OBYS 0001 TaxID=882651 RepID=UPI001BC58168|nr:cytochrome c [Roseobacter sp. OBYS 0001]GIT86727.1 cytochrome c55X [Roseobacter sp. OBYS 0001]